MSINELTNPQVEGDDGLDNERPNFFVLRWNPTISGFKLGDYEECRRNYPEGFIMGWSVWDWQSASPGDIYFMLRVDEDNPGIVFQGYFESEPYLGDNWANSKKKLHYVDISCLDTTSPSRKPLLSLSELKKAMPEVHWGHGRSGETLTSEQGEKIFNLIQDKLNA